MEKKCRTVTCPECRHSFGACFIDYGDKKLGGFAVCTKRKASFPVKR